MNRTVFFANGVIMEVEKSDRYLKRLIAFERRVNGKTPYKFTPYTAEEINAYWEKEGVTV